MSENVRTVEKPQKLPEFPVTMENEAGTTVVATDAYLFNTHLAGGFKPVKAAKKKAAKKK